MPQPHSVCLQERVANVRSESRHLIRETVLSSPVDYEHDKISYTAKRRRNMRVAYEMWTNVIDGSYIDLIYS